MNTYYVTDEEYSSSENYQKYLTENAGVGNLKIRAYAAREAIPMEGVKITVQKIIDGDEVIFFEGYTDQSGAIDDIKLPAPKLGTDNLISPKKATYDIKADYNDGEMSAIYSINMFEGVCVIQNINIVPDMTVMVGDLSGS